MDPLEQGNIGPTRYGDGVVAIAMRDSRSTQSSLACDTLPASVHPAPPNKNDAYTVHSCTENAKNERQLEHQNENPTMFPPSFHAVPPGKLTGQTLKPEEVHNRLMSHHPHPYGNIYINAVPGRSYPMGPPSGSSNGYAYVRPPLGVPYATPLPPNRAMVTGHQGQGMMHPMSALPLYPGPMPPYAPPPQQIIGGPHFHGPPNGFHDPANNAQGPRSTYNLGYLDPQGITHPSMQHPPPSSMPMEPGPPKRQLPGPWPYHAPGPVTSNAPTYNQPYFPLNGSYIANGSGSNDSKAKAFAAPHFVGIDERPGTQGPPSCLPIISDITRAKQDAIRKAAHEASRMPSKKERNVIISSGRAMPMYLNNRHDGAAFRDEYWKRIQNDPSLPVAPYPPPPVFIDRVRPAPRQNIRDRLSPYCHPYVRVTSEHIRKAIPKEASAIFHILDRRVNFDAHEADASMYSLLRSWVQDDPFRYTPPAGSNLLEYISLPSQRRIDYVHENDDEEYEDEYGGHETQDQEGTVNKPLDIFAKLNSLKHVPSIDALRASQVIRGGKRRKYNCRVHKRRHFRVLKRLKRLGIDLACIQRKK